MREEVEMFWRNERMLGWHRGPLFDDISFGCVRISVRTVDTTRAYREKHLGNTKGK